MSANWAFVAVMLSTVASAEGQWLTSRGRLVPETRFEAWGGPRTAGIGVVRPNADATAAWSAELVYAFLDRVVELRAARVWQFTRTRFATASVNAGTSVFVVPVGLNLGLGPTAGLALSLGGKTVSLDLGLQTGVDLFIFEASPRLPQRASIGVTVRVRDFTFSAMARTGADLVPGHAFVFRGDFILSLGWLVCGESENAFVSPPA